MHGLDILRLLHRIDFRMSVLTLKDGRVLSGVIATTTDRTVTLRTMAESTTLDKAEIVKTETSPSP